MTRLNKLRALLGGTDESRYLEILERIKYVTDRCPGTTVIVAVKTTAMAERLHNDLKVELPPTPPRSPVLGAGPQLIEISPTRRRAYLVVDYPHAKALMKPLGHCGMGKRHLFFLENDSVDFITDKLLPWIIKPENDKQSITVCQSGYVGSSLVDYNSPHLVVHDLGFLGYEKRNRNTTEFSIDTPTINYRNA